MIRILHYLHYIPHIMELSDINNLLFPNKSVESKVESVKNDEKTFEVKLNMKYFEPEEISVKVAKGFLTIEGKEKCEDEHGFVSWNFERQYQLPKNVVMDEIASTISSNGILSVTAPKAISMSHETNIPVVQTDKPAFIGRESDEEQEEEMELLRNSFSPVRRVSIFQSCNSNK